jgi:hypothetical protein
MDGLRRRYAHAVGAPAAYWRDRRRSRYGLLIWPSPLTPPPLHVFVPRQYGGDWLVLGE